MKQKKYFVNRYVFSMVLVMTIAITGLSYYFAIGLIIEKEGVSITAMLLMAAPWIIIILMACLEAYQLWGMLAVTEDSLEIHAFPRKPLILRFSDIRYMGLDYNNMDYGRQYWLYFAKENNDIEKYTHKMIKVPFKDGIIKCVYREEIYNAIREKMPADLQTRLDRSCEEMLLEYQQDKNAKKKGFGK